MRTYVFCGDEPTYHQVYMRRNKPRGGHPASDEITIHDMDNEDDAESCAKPSEVFKRYFGPEHGVALPPRNRYGYRPLDLSDGEER